MLPDLTPQELSKMHWKEVWEYEAVRERTFLQSLSEMELLAYVEHDTVGSYYSLWTVLEEKGSVSRTAPVLWEYLRTHPGKVFELERYHCAAALFSILGMPDPECVNELRTRVQWDHEGEEVRQLALLELKLVINRMLVPPAASDAAGHIPQAVSGEA